MASNYALERSVKSCGWRAFVLALVCLASNSNADERRTFEASTSIDLKNLKPLLTRLEDHLDLGLPVDGLVAITHSTKFGGEVSTRLNVKFQGSPVVLDYLVSMDDLDTGDLRFITESRPLAAALEREFELIFDEIGD